MLTKKHLESLSASAIDEESAAEFRLRSVEHEEAAELLGVSGSKFGSLAGIAFPYYSPYEYLSEGITLSKILSWRIRRDEADTEIVDGVAKLRRKYMAPQASGGIIYHSPDGTVLSRIYHSVDPLFITEGEKKCIALTQFFREEGEGAAVISFPGVYNWLAKGEDGKSVPTWRLNAIPFQGREVNTIFDANSRTNKDVCKAQNRLARELTSRGAIVRVWDLANIFIHGCNGVDDILATQGGPDRLRRWLYSSMPDVWSEDFASHQLSAFKVKSKTRLDFGSKRYVDSVKEFLIG